MSVSGYNPHHQGKASIEFNQEKLEIAPADLTIVWGDDDRYWKITPDDPQKPAELYQVSWLEVTGCVNKVDPGKEYKVGFTISLTPDAFGWSGSPVYVLYKRGKTGKFTGKKYILDSINQKNKQEIYVNVPPKPRGQDLEEEKKIYFGLYEVWGGKWKGGLKIHNAFIKEEGA